MSRVTPADPHHRRLEQDVVGWLRDNGFLVESNTYHERLPAEFVDRVRNMHDLNALVVRTTADRVALHRALDYSFCVECKTNSNAGRANFTFEALPLAVHRGKCLLGSRCLYVLRDVVPGRELDRCFWADNLPPFDALFVPGRHVGTELDERLRLAFPDVDRVALPHVAGSGDPFLRLSRRHVEGLFPCWKSAVLANTIPPSADIRNPG
jgi:hypothetical protein